jgi:hypothetical protein
MKKKLISLLLITVTGIVLSSCTKETTNLQTGISFKDIEGIWYFKSVVKLDGTIAPYVHLCSTKKDYVEIFTYGKTVGYVYSPDCLSKVENGGCSKLILYEGNKITGCSTTFNGTITKLTATEMRIDYAGEEHPGYIDNNFAFAKGVIFSRQ